MRRAPLIGLVAPLVLAGCSFGADKEVRPAPNAAREVGEVVRVLERSLRARDYRTVCDDLFTAAARKRAGGGDCPRLLRSTAQDLRRPSIQVLAIELRGRRASVRVRTRAEGQPPLRDTIQLVRQGGVYRIEALAG